MPSRTKEICDRNSLWIKIALKAPESMKITPNPNRQNSVKSPLNKICIYGNIAVNQSTNCSQKGYHDESNHVQYQNFNRRFEVQCQMSQKARNLLKREGSWSKDWKLLEIRKDAQNWHLIDSLRPVVRHWLTVSNNLGGVCTLLCQVYRPLKMCWWLASSLLGGEFHVVLLPHWLSVIVVQKNHDSVKRIRRAKS